MVGEKVFTRMLFISVMEDVHDDDIMNPKWQKLQKDYRSLLGLYDRLKKLPKTTERDKDVDALMKVRIVNRLSVQKTASEGVQMKSSP
jgi:hypothetical protein